MYIMTVPVSKRILLNALETEFPAFHQTKNPDKVFHLDWPDATVFLYFLHSILSFEVEGRTENFLCTLDSRKETISSEHQLAIKKADFKIRLAQLHPVSFLRTIHEKLNWGLDQRN